MHDKNILDTNIIYVQNHILNTGFYELKKSKFYCYIFKMEKFEDLDLFKEFMKKEYKDARHIIIAARFENKEVANEDREVGSSAKKILFAMQKRNDQNIAVLIARRFGGTLLGVGGVEKSFLQSYSNALNGLK